MRGHTHKRFDCLYGLSDSEIGLDSHRHPVFTRDCLALLRVPECPLPRNVPNEEVHRLDAHVIKGHV